MGTQGINSVHLMIDQKMQMYQGDFCRERDTRVLICSWNIDANKPEKLTASDDKLVREWLRGMQDPDIIVVGIQEIVDLESKKQTARKFECVLFLFDYHRPHPPYVIRFIVCLTQKDRILTRS